MVVSGSSGGTGGAVVHWEFLQGTERWQQEESAAEGNAWVILALHHLYITAELVWVRSIFCHSEMCEFCSVFVGKCLCASFHCFGDTCDK